MEIPDYIEKAHSIICTDVFQNLELTQSNSKDIRLTVNEWSQADLDIFQTRNLNTSYTAKELESKQKYLNIFKKILLNLFIKKITFKNLFRT